MLTRRFPTPDQERRRDIRQLARDLYVARAAAAIPQDSGQTAKIALEAARVFFAVMDQHIKDTNP